MFEDVAVFLEEEVEEFFRVVGDDVHFQAFNDARIFDRFVVDLEAEEFFEWQEMNAAKVEIGIGGWEAVEMGAADGGEEERVRLSGDDAMKTGV